MGDNGTAGGAFAPKARGGLMPAVSARVGYNAGMRGAKTWPYEGGHRSFCFVRWPNGGIAGGTDVDGLTAHIDLLPTLAELCGISAKTKPLDGVSLTQPLQGFGTPPERSVVVHNMQLETPRKYKDFCVMDGRWRLVRTQLWNQAEVELFDVSNDPGQTRDCASEYPERVEAMLAVYEDWWSSLRSSFENVSELVVGADEANPVLLNAHSWRTQSTEKSYNQLQVREGILIDDAYWPVRIEQSGRYRFELRRWPREADAALSGSVPAHAEPFIQTLPSVADSHTIQCSYLLGLRSGCRNLRRRPCRLRACRRSLGSRRVFAC